MEDTVMANGHTMETAEQCAKDAGAIVKCSRCYEYHAINDEAANQRAVTLALKSRDDGESGFREMSDEEVGEAVDSAILKRLIPLRPAAQLVVAR
jgi:hypothetical protein